MKTFLKGVYQAVAGPKFLTRASFPPWPVPGPPLTKASEPSSVTLIEDIFKATGPGMEIGGAP
jgi:hypothetical protein